MERTFCEGRTSTDVPEEMAAEIAQFAARLADFICRQADKGWIYMNILTLVLQSFMYCDGNCV